MALAASQHTRGSPLWRESLEACASSEALETFPMFSAFLPRGPSERLDHNASYVRTRGERNSAFFDETRARLTKLRDDFPFLAISGVGPVEVVQLKQEIASAQGIALGYTGGREFRKALVLGRLCGELCDLYAARADQQAGLLFWQALSRLNLGAACSGFRQPSEAQEHLGWTTKIDRGQAASSGSGLKEMLLVASAHAHLSQLYLGLIDMGPDAVPRETSSGHRLSFPEDEASLGIAARSHASHAAELFEELVLEASSDKFDRNDQVAVLVSSYVNLGICHLRLDDLEAGHSWLLKADTMAQEQLDPHDPLLAEIRRQLEHSGMLRDYRPPPPLADAATRDI